jgi:hypothetical protein
MPEQGRRPQWAAAFSNFLLTSLLGSAMLRIVKNTWQKTNKTYQRSKTMDKEEILKMSRAEKKDEGVAYAENKGRRFGVIAFSAVFIVILFFNLFTGRDNFAPFSMFWAYVAAEALGHYSVTKERKFMVTTVFAAIASVCFLASYILSVVL